MKLILFSILFVLLSSTVIAQKGMTGPYYVDSMKLDSTQKVNLKEIIKQDIELSHEMYYGRRMDYKIDNISILNTDVVTYIDDEFNCHPGGSGSLAFLILADVEIKGLA